MSASCYSQSLQYLCDTVIKSIYKLVITSSMYPVSVLQQTDVLERLSMCVRCIATRCNNRYVVCCSTDTGYILLVMTSLYIDLITVSQRYCNDWESWQFFWIIVSIQITIFFACSSFCSFGNAEKNQ
jgi:hypothetical protein